MPEIMAPKSILFCLGKRSLIRNDRHFVKAFQLPGLAGRLEEVLLRGPARAHSCQGSQVVRRLSSRAYRRLSRQDLVLVPLLQEPRDTWAQAGLLLWQLS